MVAAVVPQRISPPRVDPRRPHLRLVPPIGAGYEEGARPAARTRLHSPAVYRRRRLVALAGLTLVVGGLAALAVLWAVARAATDSSATGLAASRPAAARVWIVGPGDTLWAIALASGAKGDIRPLVDALSAEVHGQPLLVGERITLP